MALTVNDRPRIDTNAAKTTLQNELNRLRTVLVASLDPDNMRDFTFQNRNLADFQAHVHAMEVLDKANLSQFSDKSFLPQVAHPSPGSDVATLASVIGETAVARAVSAV